MRIHRLSAKALMIGVFLVAIVGLTVSNALARPSNPVTHPAGAGPYKENPSPALPGNSFLPPSAFLSQAQIEGGDAPSGATRLSVRLMRWGDYLQQEFGGTVKSYYVAPDRMVWVLKEYYRDGYTYRHGVMKDATVTTAFDAQSGQVLHTRVQGIPE